MRTVAAAFTECSRPSAALSSGVPRLQDSASARNARKANTGRGADIFRGLFTDPHFVGSGACRLANVNEA
jgi:hypothetical protein